MLTYYNEAIKPMNDELAHLLETLEHAKQDVIDLMVESHKAHYIDQAITKMTDPIYCPSYFDDKNVLQNCTCGWCDKY